MWTTTTGLTIISTIRFTGRVPTDPVGGSRGCGRRRGGWVGWCPSVAVCLCSVNLAPRCYIYVRSSASPASTPLSSTVTFTADLHHESVWARLLLTHVGSRFDLLQQWRLEKVFFFFFFAKFRPCCIHWRGKALMVIKAGCSCVYVVWYRSISHHRAHGVIYRIITTLTWLSEMEFSRH